MKRDIAYGTLDLRIGQGLDLVEKQVMYVAKNKPKEWYFDIIHTPNQTPKALALLPIVEELIIERSKLPKIAVTVKLNTNTKILRARNELFKKAYDKDIDVKTKKVE